MYESEIKMMMYSFGDARIPKTSTSRYIEGLVKNQAKILILKSKGIQKLRKGSVLEAEDVCFALRKDKEKVFRILQSLSMKMYRLDMNDDEALVENEEDINMLEFEWFDKSDCKGWSERLRKLNEYTSQMSVEEYMEYSKCREASFTYRKTRKFKTFLGMGKVKDGVADVLGFFCYEMVFELVDAGLRIRRERYERYKARGCLSPIECSQALDVEDIEEGFRRILRDRAM